MSNRSCKVKMNSTQTGNKCGPSGKDDQGGSLMEVECFLDKQVESLVRRKKDIVMSVLMTVELRATPDTGGVSGKAQNPGNAVS